jgi:hypothetical protein
MFDFDVVTGPMPDRNPPQGTTQPAGEPAPPPRTGRDGPDPAERGGSRMIGDGVGDRTMTRAVPVTAASFRT